MKRSAKSKKRPASVLKQLVKLYSRSFTQDGGVRRDEFDAALEPDLMLSNCHVDREFNKTLSKEQKKARCKGLVKRSVQLRVNKTP